MSNELSKIRDDLHQIPELGRCEFETKKYILNFVNNLNCQIFMPIPTGVVLYFNAFKDNTICFRADMDGLGISEDNNSLNKSKHKGLMHACGHDGHMSMLLGFAKYASDNINLLQNNIVCLFQPSEEDKAGAMDIIKSGILDELNVKRIFAFHIWPTLENGKLYTMPYGMLAKSSEIDIDIIGKSCHAANRTDTYDALLAGIRLIENAYTESAKIEESHLLSFGKINAGEARNSVACNCHIEATLRTFCENSFNIIKEAFNKIVRDIELKYLVKINLKINALYEAVINDLDLVNEYKDYLNLNILNKPYLQAEDFGCYTNKYKAMFILIGCGNERLLHTSTFDFDTNILQLGLDTYKKIALKKIN